MAVSGYSPLLGYLPKAPTTKLVTKPKNIAPVVTRPPVTTTPVAAAKPAAMVTNTQPANIYDTYVKGFGGAANYAKAITDKVSAGKTLDDQSAADAFIKSNSGLFTPGFSLTKPEEKPPVVVDDRQSLDQGLEDTLNNPITAPAVNLATIPIAEAIRQARMGIDPLYQQSRTNAGTANQQLADLIRQRIGATGELRGGGFVQGNIDIADQLQKTLGDIDVGYNTQIGQMSQAIQDRDFDRQARIQDATTRLWEGQNTANSQRIANALTLMGLKQNQSQFDKSNELAWAQFNRPYSELTLGEKNSIDLQAKQLGETIRSNKVQEGQRDTQIKNDFTLGQGGLAVSRGNLGVAQGNLGVSQGQLKLGQDKFAFDKTQGTGTSAVDSVKSDLATLSPAEALKELTGFPQDYIRDIGIDEYNKLLKEYRYAIDNGY